MTMKKETIRAVKLTQVKISTVFKFRGKLKRWYFII